MLNLLQWAVKRNWHVTFVSAAQQSTHCESLSSLGIATHPIALNCSSFDNFVAELDPNIVIFDRFMTEEQFSWRVATAAPDALRVLNTEDCHGLRHFRQKSLANNLSLTRDKVVLRETAAILRCDISLIISTAEMEWLTNTLSVPTSQLLYVPLLVKADRTNLSFNERKHISFIGNFKHAPNWEAVQTLRRLWPKIKAQLGDVECHIYGSYPPPKATALSSTKLGFLVKGWVDNADEAFNSYRLALAPLRFGAGIKGKLLRAIATHTPSVTTAIGCEGIANETQWPGAVTHTDNEFVEQTIALYSQQETWHAAQSKAITLAEQLCAKEQEVDAAFVRLKQLTANVNEHRNQHMLAAILNQQSMRSHQYMSQWIEAKNKLAQRDD